ncbi:hypothetical protein FA15DRAFT_668398 [Coprinopsis marcescibilis]|uniref:Uncharacterized protein n=1 Tax=Coprinopsis marcescibilis TaxID=230819 RepID=A0A5C3KXZ2_COPMA|nr:hypothetical protein FA15DRAFT_668398 [Coprinopsis marcescibilis]
MQMRNVSRALIHAEAYTRPNTQRLIRFAFHRYNSNLLGRTWQLHSKLWSGVAFGAGIGLGLSATAVAFYELSGWRAKVDTAHETLQAVNQLVGRRRDEKPSELLKLIRKAVKEYFSGVPFSGPILDMVFDSVGDNIDLHPEEAMESIRRMSKDLDNILELHTTWTVETAREIMAVVNRETSKLKELGLRPETQKMVQSVNQSIVTASKDALAVATSLAAKLKGKVVGEKNDPEADEN